MHQHKIASTLRAKIAQLYVYQYWLWCCCLVLCCHATLFAENTSEQKKTICLNMIVKNEKEVIERCLNSAKRFIDYWVIVDTGSTDGTQDVIRAFLRDIPGELHERPWVNFAHNRQEALELAKDKADYLMFVDADEQLVYPENFALPDLTKDLYLVTVRMKAHTFGRNLFASTRVNWEWKGVLHEYLSTTKPNCTVDMLPNIENWAVTDDGHRSQDPKKHEKDAAVLEKAIETEPDNSRYVYYLAQEYLNANQFEKALKYYQKRSEMGGWDEEVFVSLYAVARLQQQLQMPPETFLNSYCKAYHFRPSRAEPLFHLACYYFHKEQFIIAYSLAKEALSLSVHKDTAYREDLVFDYALLALFADCSHNLRYYREAKKSYDKLLHSSKTPQLVKEAVEKRLVDYHKHLPFL